MSNKSILVTGGAGFIGSHFIRVILDKYPHINVVNLDKLTYAGKIENLSSVENNDRYHFVKGDICDQKLVESLFDQYHFDAVFHFAAESHVDNSILGPQVFIETNILGTFQLLQAAKNNWSKKEFKDCLFMHVSTDEVYGHLGVNDPLFTEKTPYDPSSPYSASKAGADHLVSAYGKTYGLPIIITNCSNNYGPNQDNEKLIPTVIRKAMTNQKIPVYGKGLNVRDWLYVEDHCYGILSAYESGKVGEKYNIGTNNEWQNIELVKYICQYLDDKFPKAEGSYLDQISFVTDRLGHDFRYGIDSSKLKIDTGWEPQFSFEDAMKITIDYYVNLYRG